MESMKSTWHFKTSSDAFWQYTLNNSPNKAEKNDKTLICLQQLQLLTFIQLFLEWMLHTSSWDISDLSECAAGFDAQRLCSVLWSSGVLEAALTSREGQHCCGKGKRMKGEITHTIWHCLLSLLGTKIWNLCNHSNYSVLISFWRWLKIYTQWVNLHISKNVCMHVW